MGVIRKLADLIVFSNLFVAFAVACLTLQSVILYTGAPDLRYPAFVFFATLCLYNFHRVYRMRARSEKEQGERRHLWIKENLLLFYLIFGASAIGLIFVTWSYIDTGSLIVLLPVVLISLGYSVPFIPVKGKWLRLRDIPLIKIFLISVVLSWVTVILPFHYYNVEAMSKVYFFLPGLPVLGLAVAARMLFIFSITIPFDIRDMVHDERSGLATIPVLSGERRARMIAAVSLAIFALLILFYVSFYRAGWYYYALALLVSAFATGMVISKATKEKKEYFYTFLVEGMMVLQFGLVFLAYRLSL